MNKAAAAATAASKPATALRRLAGPSERVEEKRSGLPLASTDGLAL